MTTTDPTPESARALLYRHGLPEDVIDGVLCLHGQELAAKIRTTDLPDWYETVDMFDNGTAWAADLIDPTVSDSLSGTANAVPAAVEEQPDTNTPCGPVPEACDAEAGEPCANHERQQAHAEGEHELCGNECEPGASLARHITAHRLSDVQAAFRILGWPITFELRPNDEPAAVAQPGKEA